MAGRSGTNVLAGASVLAWLLILSLVAAFPSRAHGQACAGDCDADRLVLIDELVLAVRIALGAAAPSDCEGLDADADGSVAIDELLQAVDASLFACPNTLRIFGKCLAPGAAGLVPCPRDTRVLIGRCLERRRCLEGSATRRLLAIEFTDRDGSFRIGLERDAITSVPLVFEAELDGGARYRAFGFPDAGGSALQIRIDPRAEAGATLLDENGLENFDDEGVQAVLAAVDEATAALDFTGLDPAAAAALAANTAREDSGVRETIAGRATPAPTATSTPTSTITPTSTATPTPVPGRCVPDEQPSPIEAEVPTLRLGRARGVVGHRVCFGASLDLAGREDIIAIQADISIARARLSDVRIPAACALAPNINAEFTFAPMPSGCEGPDCEHVRIFVVEGNFQPLPAAPLLFTCEVDIPAGAATGETYTISCSETLASDRVGTPIDLQCSEGLITVIQ